MRDVVYRALVEHSEVDLDVLKLLYGLNTDMSAIARSVGVSVVSTYLPSTLSYVVGNIIVVNNNLDFYSAKKEIAKGLRRILRREGMFK